MSDTHIEISLDSILPSGEGLANAPYAYDFRVKAKDSGNIYLDSEYSGTIRIIDSPLLRDGGQAYASGDDEALLKWTTATSARNYEIRYRKLGFYTTVGIGERDHTSLDWPKGATWPYYHGAETETSDTPGNETIDDLDEGDIYAFQVNYEIGDTKVFSAQDAYVWLSDAKPGNDARVATYPFFGHHAGRTFEYFICQNGFPASQKTQWANLIKSAFGEWQDATSRFITMDVTVETCDTGTGVTGTTPITTFIQNDDLRNEVRMLDVPSSDAFKLWEFKSDVFKGLCLPGSSACVTSFTGYTGIRYDHETRQLILDNTISV